MRPDDAGLERLNAPEIQLIPLLDFFVLKGFCLLLSGLTINRKRKCKTLRERDLPLYLPLIAVVIGNVRGCYRVLQLIATGSETPWPNNLSLAIGSCTGLQRAIQDLGGPQGIDFRC